MTPGSRLSGKRAVVTGAAGGIGSAIATLFAQEGADVTGLDLARPSGDQAFLSCDVSDSGSVEDAFSALSADGRPLDILVNAAGMAGPRGRVHEVGLEDWQKVIDVNLRGAFLVMRAAVPLMLARNGGSIINIASVTGLRGMREVSAYSTSKAGVVQLSRAAALDYAQRGIRVNAICPGPVDTPMLGRQTQEFLAQLSASVPMRRLAAPADVAQLALFLASDDAVYVTGQCQVVDGGFLAA